MELVKTTPKGTMIFQLTDGRQLLNYKSGYVRLKSPVTSRLYQLNPVVPYKERNGGISRKLIKDPTERMEFCVNWVKKNVKPGLYTDRKRIKCLEYEVKHFKALLENVGVPLSRIYSW